MTKTLNLIAPVNKTGYGVTGYNILRTLQEKGWQVSLFPKGDPRVRTEPHEVEVIQKGLNQAHQFDHDAPCLCIWHQFDLAYRVGRGKYVGWPIFELDQFNELEYHHLTYPDELVVCSQWAKDVLQNNSIFTDTHVVPLGVDQGTFRKQPLPDGTYTFLVAGKWELRKGHKEVCDAFNFTFEPNEDVRLIVLCHNPFLTPKEQAEWQNYYMESPMGKAGKIEIWPWLNTHAEVATAMYSAHCGVFPARAEGWNLELLEMMAMGRQVITTDYSGHTEFCTKDNAKLIPCQELETAYDGKWFKGQGQWMRVGDEEVKQMVKHMHDAYTNRELNTGGIETGKQYTWENSVAKIEEIFA